MLGAIDIGGGIAVVLAIFVFWIIVWGVLCVRQALGFLKISWALAGVSEGAFTNLFLWRGVTHSIADLETRLEINSITTSTGMSTLICEAGLASTTIVLLRDSWPFAEASVTVPASVALGVWIISVFTTSILDTRCLVVGILPRTWALAFTLGTGVPALLMLLWQYEVEIPLIVLAGLHSLSFAVSQLGARFLSAMASKNVRVHSVVSHWMKQN